MSKLPWATIVRLVHARARNCCEYCQTRQAMIGQALHVEHIDPRGGNDLENLCLACPTCNLSKATATAAPDPETKETATLFNPRAGLARTFSLDRRRATSPRIDTNR